MVWLKHDLRLSDHAPLAEALGGGTEILLLYVVEPERMEQPDESMLHLAWDLANAHALLNEVREKGGTMQIHVGRPTEIFDQLHARFPLTNLHSYEETGLLWSWDRDKRVAAWCDANGEVLGCFDNLRRTSSTHKPRCLILETNAFAAAKTARRAPTSRAWQTAKR